MKYLILLGDGMSDNPDEHGNTPLSLAKKPYMDKLTGVSELGLVQTVPEGFSPGSDVANLSAMGFDPKKFYTGRSPLEAASIGIRLQDGDITYRVNLVTLGNEPTYRQKTMLDYSAGEIDTESARTVIDLLKPLVPAHCELFAGVSYRHCLVDTGGRGCCAGNSSSPPPPCVLTPPHNITGKPIAEHLPKGGRAEDLLKFMEQSNELLSSHPQNNTAANSAWIWGEGTKPALPDFYKEHGIKGAVISAVDLLKGIGLSANMTVIPIKNATGNLHTNWDGKADAALNALKTHDFVFVHIEAPDECGHQGDKSGKIKAIELFDEKIVGRIFNALKQDKQAFKMVIMPDHATPLCLKTHTCDPVPYILYDSQNEQKNDASSYTEAAAKKSGNFIPQGCQILQKLLGK